jgi:hypothetical protein
VAGSGGAVAKEPIRAEAVRENARAEKKVEAGAVAAAAILWPSFSASIKTAMAK